MDWLATIYWNNPLRNYLVAGSLILAGLLVGWLIAALLRRWVTRRYQQTEGRLDDVVAGVGHRLLGTVVVLAGLYGAFRVLVLPDWLAPLLWTGFVVAWTLLGALFVGRLVNGLIVHYLRRHVDGSAGLLDEQLVPIMRTVIAAAVWIIAALFALANLGFAIGSILAGLGIGGLALAMASKDLLSNVFGAFTILVQGPFRVGDAVVYQGHSGTIERLGLRATELRTWDGNLVTVPNALATTSVIENISRRPAFRVLFQLRLEPAKGGEGCDRAAGLIREAISAVGGVRPEPLVHLLELGAAALVYQVLYYIEDQDRILDIRHQVNCRIHESLDRAGIRLAPPVISLPAA